MTVGELLEELQKHPTDLPVWVDGGDGYGPYKDNVGVIALEGKVVKQRRGPRGGVKSTPAGKHGGVVIYVGWHDGILPTEIVSE